ncbi:MAG: threonine--tRNA ligase [Candidatus Methylomirabilia bacterium]
MSTIRVTFPDTSTAEFPSGTAAGKALQGRGSSAPGVPGSLVAARVDGRLTDLTTPLTADCRIEGVGFDSPDGRDVFRHSSSHILAEAVADLFPGTKFAIGPAIEEGFYYDFDVEKPFTPEDLERIEKRMAEIVKANNPFVRSELARDEARRTFREKGEIYKAELIEAIHDPTVSIYRQGGFTDLCRGPHITSTAKIKAFKLLSVAGAYWRGDEKNRMLQRIYGTSFPDKAALEAHLHRIEEAKKRDHRKLGKELDLFSFADEVGPGLVLWHPKGALLRYIVEEFERREHIKRGYQMVFGPRILREELWRRSGHYDNYRENMYFTEIDEQRYGIKPMNCLAHMMIYKSHRRSYRDLPLRYFELGTVNRHEKSGVLHGLTRVREFTQDDAHIICAPEQLQGEIAGVLGFIKDVMGLFGFAFTLELSTRPEKSIGSDADWELATGALREALEAGGFAFAVNAGDGAFYGPKIDVKLQDAIGRSWQCATVQCDFTLPERFDLTYIAADGQPKRPVMIHRVVLGSIERFIAVLIEHFAGAFPFWLAPVQICVLTITSAQDQYGREVAARLRAAGHRVEEDLRNEKIGYKIREAQLQKVPFMAILGAREQAEGRVAVRRREQGDVGTLSLDEFVGLLNEQGGQRTVTVA